MSEYSDDYGVYTSSEGEEGLVDFSDESDVDIEDAALDASALRKVGNAGLRGGEGFPCWRGWGWVGDRGWMGMLVVSICFCAV